MSSCSSFFFFNDTATTEIYTLSLHDALPISMVRSTRGRWAGSSWRPGCLWLFRSLLAVTGDAGEKRTDRKSTRLNSSHLVISYAVFCLKKKNAIKKIIDTSAYSTELVRAYFE